MRAPGSFAVLGALGITAMVALTTVSCSSAPAATPAAAAGSGSTGSGSTGSTAATGPSGPAGSTSSARPTVVPARPSAGPPPVGRGELAGSGHFVVVPGRVDAPGRGAVRTVRVEVESGLGLDAPAVAAFVLATLNDTRSWAHAATMTFARTDGTASIVVRLGSPTTTAALCRPLVTYGRLSCSQGRFAILTSYRWFHGQPEFDSLTQYRQYVVNHEVGHVLGHGHLHCPGPGALAPVMQQQTKGVAPCRPNAWPFP